MVDLDVKVYILQINGSGQNILGQEMQGLYLEASQADMKLVMQFEVLNGPPHEDLFQRLALG